MENDVNRILMVGLPETGKTTFLAAFYHLTTNAADKPGSLVLNALSDQRKYLEEIVKKWLEFKEPGRTNLNLISNESLSLHDREKDISLELMIPDLSGESFNQMFENRLWSEKLKKLSNDAFGILLFIHPNKVTPSPTILPSVKLVEEINPKDVDKEISGPTGEAWSPKHVSTQVKIVDLLQLLLRDGRNTKIKKIAIMISAWDVLSDQQKVPAEWLNERLPFLRQFLNSHQKNYSFEVFGISAQGGDLNKDKEKLQAYQNPNERIKIHGNKDLKIIAHDIAYPIKWLIS